MVGTIAGHTLRDSGGVGESREEGHEEYGLELHLRFSCGAGVGLVVEIGH